MNIVVKIFKRIKSEGLRNALRYTVIKWLRLDRIEEKVNTLYYFQNQYNDITKLPPTSDPDLRILQKCDAVFLAIFDKLCQKHKLTYWLDYGTLLGAVRHKGFIPWDDDTDIAMPRNDYNRLYNVLRKDFDDLEIQYDEKSDIPMMMVGLGYNHYSTGIWMDIYPVDECFADINRDDAKKNVARMTASYRKFYHTHKKNGEKDLIAYKNELMNALNARDEKHFIHPMEAGDPITVNRINEIYPLKRTYFEEFELCVPNNCDAYLKEMYGNSYMNFPTGGVEHHGGEGTNRPALKTWAKLNNVDMFTVYADLKKKYESLEIQQ